MTEQLSTEVPPWESFVVEGQVEVDYQFELLPLGKLAVDYHEDLLERRRAREERARLSA